LKVPSAEKDKVKALGAGWDASARSWYAYKKRIEDFIEWLPEPLKSEVNQQMAARAKRWCEGQEWEAHPLRSQDAAEILRIAGLSQLRPVSFHLSFCANGSAQWF